MRLRLPLLACAVAVSSLPWLLGTPTAPVGLRPGEGTPWLMAESLAHDGDLRFEAADRARAVAKSTGGEVSARLMSADGWTSAYFGEPYPYALMAAAGCRFGGERGILAVNLLLLLGAVAAGCAHLRRANSAVKSAGFAAAYFILGGGLVAAFRIGPELLDMFAVTAALVLGLSTDRAPNRLLRAVGSGLLLAVAVYDQPLLVVFVLPLAFAGRRHLAVPMTMVLSGLAGFGLLAVIGATLTPAPWAFFGVERRDVAAADAPPAARLPLEEAADSEFPLPGAWRVPPTPPPYDGRRLRLDAIDFLIERHVGILGHRAPLLVALALFLFHERRRRSRWLLLVAAVGASVALLVWLPEAWDGAGGGLGSRHTLAIYPAFLMLVGRLAPTPLLIGGGTLCGLLAAPSILALLGSGGAVAGDYAVASRWPLRLLPVTPRIATRSDDYHCDPIPGIVTCGRPTLFDQRKFTIQFPAGRSEAWIVAPDRLDEPRFRVRGLLPGETAEVDFEGAHERPADGVMFAVKPHGHPLRRGPRDTVARVYHLVVRTPSAIEVAYLRTAREVAANPYRVEWFNSPSPDRVEVGRKLHILARFANRSETVWPAVGEAAVRLGCHWLDAADQPVVWEGERQLLGSDLEPGGLVALNLRTVAPDEPGHYTLVLDLVYENVGWFSAHDPGNARRIPIEVVGRGVATGEAP